MAERPPQSTEDQGLSSTGQVIYETYAPYIAQSSPEVCANIIVCLIHQASFLLDRQIRSLEEAFVKEGGLRERMTRVRLQERNRRKP